jgi:hypothetical protein
MTTWDYPSAKNRRDPLWRARHGFDSIDPKPTGWPVVGHGWELRTDAVALRYRRSK